jgi:hypothetical protein
MVQVQKMGKKGGGERVHKLRTMSVDTLLIKTTSQ